MSPAPASRTLLPSVVAIAAAVFLAHFARFQEFGLYEDDYWSIAPHLEEPVSKLAGLFAQYFSEWPTGRPLNYFLPAALAVIGSALAGLKGIYLLAAAWLTANAVLVFLVARRLTSDAAALAGALAYVLFPADTTKILLVHAAHIQGAMTFLLLGTWLWLGGGTRRLASYPVAALALLSYETAFLPFLAVPLLQSPDRRRTVRALALHLTACLALLGSVAAIRLSIGDGRASAVVANPAQAVHRMSTSLLLGPATSGRAFVQAAASGARRLDPASGLAATVVVFAFAALGLAGGWRRDAAGRDAGRPAVPWWWLLAVSLLVWSGSYALTLVNYPPTQTAGRMTSTHVAAAWPVSLVAAAALEALRRRARWLRCAAVAALVAWAVCLFGHHQEVQRQYARSWQLQKGFWRQVMSLVPEAGLGWSVIVDGSPAASGPAIAANSWADYLVYRLIFRTGFDAMQGFDAGGPDFAHLGNLRGLVPFRRTGDGVEWKPQFYSGVFVPIDASRLALLVDDHGALRRVPEMSTPAGTLVAPAVPTVARRESWPSTPLSRLLFPERSR